VNDYVPAEDVEAPLSYTGKSSRGSLFTLRANDAAQFLDRATDVIESNVLEWVGKLDTELQEKTGAASPAGGARQSGSPSRSGRPSTQNQSSGTGSRGAASSNSNQGGDVEYHPEGITCPKCNGAVIFKSITAKNGKNAGRTFEMWTCENQGARGDGHLSEFIN
jgi:hypothetical protein